MVEKNYDHLSIKGEHDAKDSSVIILERDDKMAVIVKPRRNIPIIDGGTSKSVTVRNVKIEPVLVIWYRLGRNDQLPCRIFPLARKDVHGALREMARGRQELREASFLPEHE